MKKTLLSLLGIVVCATPGTLLSLWLVRMLGLAGIGGALLTVFVAMVVSVALFAGLIAGLKAAGSLK